jgi:hypothetical protein
MSIILSRKLTYLLPSLLLISLVVCEWLRILGLNQGVFIYTLDDPYIHLSLAQQIGRGEYGLCPGEYSSPSSSILWPFLLAPFSYFSFYQFAPLFLNILCVLCILWLFIWVCLKASSSSKIQWQNIILFCLLIPTLNLLGLVFSGMEHALQTLLSILVIVGLIEEINTNQLPPWLAVVIILGPLLRYENLALSIPALLFLFYRGHRKKTLYIGGILILLLCLFSFFLLLIGQPPLPTAVLNKLHYGFYRNPIERLLIQLNINLRERQAIIFLAFCSVFLSYIFFSTISSLKKRLLAILTVSLLLHLTLARFNWYHRYEIYLYASVWLLLFYFYFEGLASNPKKKQLYWLLLPCLIFTSLPYFTVPFSIATAANNIFLQQHQMRDFVINWVKAPVAVNDIGCLSRNNPYPVLDLWGLGNYRVFQARVTQKNSDWMIKESEQAKVKLAMIYKDWFPFLPKNWILLGCLDFTAPVVSAGESRVRFYATKAKYFPELKEKLRQFSSNLPPGAGFNFNCSRKK